VGTVARAESRVVHQHHEFVLQSYRSRESEIVQSVQRYSIHSTKPSAPQTIAAPPFVICLVYENKPRSWLQSAPSGFTHHRACSKNWAPSHAGSQDVPDTNCSSLSQVPALCPPSLLVLLPILRPLVLARSCRLWDPSKVRCSGRTSRCGRAYRRNRWRRRRLWERERRR
jgi:hypothetical protein